MKKICLLINSLQPGGAEKIVINILGYYKNVGHECFIVLLEKSVFYDIPENVKVTYLTNYKSNISDYYKLFLLPILAYKLKQFLIRNNISYVQSHTYRSNYVNVLSKIFGSDHIAHIVNHGIISLYNKLGLKGKINKTLIKYLYPKSDKIILTSEGMLLDFKKLIKSDNLNTSIIINPHDIKKIVELSSEEIEENEFSLNETKKYIISLGSLIGLKRNSDLIMAYKDFQTKQSNVELLFIGDGEERENLIKLVNELQLNDKIHFIGRVFNPYKYLSRSFVFVLNSSSEAFPNVIIEALACECPVISSDCFSGPREILTTFRELNFVTDKIELGEFGILYPVGNINLLTESLEKMFNENDLYNYYKNKCLNRAKQFDIETMMNKYLEILECPGK